MMQFYIILGAFVTKRQSLTLRTFLKIQGKKGGHGDLKYNTARCFYTKTFNYLNFNSLFQKLNILPRSITNFLLTGLKASTSKLKSLH